MMLKAEDVKRLMFDKLIADQIKSLAIEAGADLVGIAPIDRFKNAPLKLSPQGLLPGANSVIVAAVHHPDACVELAGEPTLHDHGPYWIQMTMNEKLDFISFRTAKFLEDKGYESLPTVSSRIIRFRPFEGRPEGFTPELSHIHAGAAAGLGEIGYSGLLITPEYGPRVRVVSIITTAILEPTPMYNGPSLCDHCGECIKHCPVKAFSKEIIEMAHVEIGGKVYKYPKKNMWRCCWAEGFQLNLNLPIPDKVNEEIILEMLAKHGTYTGEVGGCLKYCLPPHLRLKGNREGNNNEFKRKKLFVNNIGKVIDRKLTDEIRLIAIRNGADYVGVFSLDILKENNIDSYYSSPDISTVIAIGIRCPRVSSDIYRDEISSEVPYTVEGMIRRRFHFISLDISRYLDNLGYSALPLTDISHSRFSSLILTNPTDIGCQVLEQNEANIDLKVSFILTSAGLTLSDKESSSISTDKSRPIIKKAKTFTSDLKVFVKQRGADLIGIASAERISKIEDQLIPYINMEELNLTIKDKSPTGRYGPFIPELSHRNVQLLGPNNYLSKACSVIVIGIHYPTACLTQAAELPAESLVPYSYAQFETLNQLDDVALDVVGFLLDSGYIGVPSLDLFRHASKMASARGFLFDNTANSYCAVAAGLAVMGRNGIALTPEYGFCQRFITIITDAPLDPDSIYNGKEPCTQCLKCVEACPTQALSKVEKVIVEIEGRKITHAKCDRLRCDWAKRYGLIAEEGPRYIGSTLDIKPPSRKIAGKDIMEAVKYFDPLQKFLCILERCIKDCPMKTGFSEV